MAGPNSLEQTRITELELYVPGGVGEPSLSEIVILVDHSSFDRPKRLAYDYTGSSVYEHSERGRLEALTDADVEITFSSPFSTIPIEVKFEVYRIAEVSPGVWRRKEVLWYGASSSWLTIDGFNIVIDEDLTGVVIEYAYEE